MVLAQGPPLYPPPDWHETLGGERWKDESGGWLRGVIEWLKKRGYLSDATT